MGNSEATDFLVNKSQEIEPPPVPPPIPPRSKNRYSLPPDKCASFHPQHIMSSSYPLDPFSNNSCNQSNPANSFSYHVHTTHTFGNNLHTDEETNVYMNLDEMKPKKSVNTFPVKAIQTHDQIYPTYVSNQQIKLI